MKYYFNLLFKDICKNFYVYEKRSSKHFSYSRIQKCHQIKKKKVNKLHYGERKGEMALHGKNYFRINTFSVILDNCENLTIYRKFTCFIVFRNLTQKHVN